MFVTIVLEPQIYIKYMTNWLVFSAQMNIWEGE